MTNSKGKHHPTQSKIDQQKCRSSGKKPSPSMEVKAASLERDKETLLYFLWGERKADGKGLRHLC